MAFQREWPDPEFVKEVEEAFPDQGIANVEEARVSVAFDSADAGISDSHH